MTTPASTASSAGPALGSSFPDAWSAVIGLIGPGPALRLLDVGGRTGGRTERLSTVAAELVVMDPDPRSIAQGRVARPRITFIEGTAERLPFPEARFDRVLTTLALHHFADAPRALREMRRVLVPGGLVIVLDVRRGSGAARFFAALHRLMRGEPLSFWTPEALESELAAADLRPTYSQEFGSKFVVAAAR